MSDTVRAGRRSVEISNPGKLLFSKARVTKLDLARYYERVSNVMVRHARGRPVTMQAFPGGVEGPGFYLKDAPDHFPGWIHRATVPKRGGTVTHVLCDDAATLVYLAGQNCITVHVWLSRADDLRRPDRLIFDFDPATERFAEVRASARELGELLRDLGLEPFAMTTGSRGLHVTVPLRRSASFEEARSLARRVAGRLVDEHPQRLTVEWSKAKRRGRIYLDTGRNAYAQHGVAPYAVRARDKAPVATPLHWEELGDRSLRPDRWTIATVLDRLDADGDPWREVGRSARSLSSAVKRLS